MERLLLTSVASRRWRAGATLTMLPNAVPTAPRAKRVAPLNSVRVAVGSAAAGASWMALVAATTVGLATVQRVRAEVSVDAGAFPTELSDEYRLIVQSYSAGSLVDGVPVAHARPLASTQRSVTAEELSRGVAVDVVDVGERADDSAVIVAWIESGAPNLEFDGRRARPARGAPIGIAQSAGDAQAHIVLSRKAA